MLCSYAVMPPRAMTLMCSQRYAYAACTPAHGLEPPSSARGALMRPMAAKMRDMEGYCSATLRDMLPGARRMRFPPRFTASCRSLCGPLSAALFSSTRLRGRAGARARRRVRQRGEARAAVVAGGCGCGGGSGGAPVDARPAVGGAHAQHGHLLGDPQAKERRPRRQGGGGGRTLRSRRAQGRRGDRARGERRSKHAARGAATASTRQDSTRR